MSNALIVAMLSAGLAIFVGLVGVIWNLLKGRIKDVFEQLSERIETIWNQVGRNSESGMRKTVHASANLITAHMGELKELEHRMEQVEKRLERNEIRIERLESRSYHTPKGHQE